LWLRACITTENLEWDISFLNTDPIVEMSGFEPVTVILVLSLLVYAEELLFPSYLVTGSQLLSPSPVTHIVKVARGIDKTHQVKVLLFS